MKKLLVFTLLATFANIGYSQNSISASEDAPKSYLLNLLSECKEYAAVEEITEQNLNAYLLQCINEELEASYYKNINKLPVEE